MPKFVHKLWGPKFCNFLYTAQDRVKGLDRNWQKQGVNKHRTWLVLRDVRARSVPRRLYSYFIVNRVNHVPVMLQLPNANLSSMSIAFFGNLQGFYKISKLSCKSWGFYTYLVKERVTNMNPKIFFLPSLCIFHFGAQHQRKLKRYFWNLIHYSKKVRLCLFRTISSCSKLEKTVNKAEILE